MHSNWYVYKNVNEENVEKIIWNKNDRLTKQINRMNETVVAQKIL